MAKLPAGAKCLVCLVALSLGCAQAHSRRERRDRDRDEVEADPASIAAEPAPAESEPSEAPPSAPDPSPSSPADVANGADDPPVPEPTGARDAGPGEGALPAQPDPSLQVFDPRQVYVFGDADDFCETMVAPASDPGRMIAGFGCTSYGQLQIRAGDGRLVYSAFPGGLRVFSCDGCVLHQNGAAYPMEPQSNDVQIASPCAGDDFDFPVFRALPDGGIVHSCGPEWRDQDARSVVASKPYVWAFGHANTALREDGVLSLGDAQLRPFAGLPDGSRGPYRVREDGYWLVIGDASRELWHVAFDGTASRVGMYPELPGGQKILWSSELDAEGRLYQIAREEASLRKTIVRRGTDGTSEVIYADPAGSRRWKDLFFLFTGP